MKTTVVVGVEGTSSSRHALLWAAETAHGRGAELVLVYATGFPMIALDLLDGEGLHPAAMALLEEEAAAARASVPGVEMRLEVDPRLPAMALTEMSRHAALVVVGSHRLTAREARFPGSLGYQVAAGAFCPVVIVPGLPPGTAHGVVVGADGSADGLEAVALAAAEADLTGQDLHVVHTWQQPAMYVQAAIYVPDLDQQVREQEEVVLAESVAGLAGAYPDLVVHPHLVEGKAASALLEAAATARLLVVGSRGRHGVVRALLGSVSHTVVLHAPCPVMVARVREHHRLEHD